MGVVESAVSFAVVAGLLTIVPGLDTALVLRAALVHGRKQAFATALGINTGTLVWGAGAALGVSALLTASTTAFTLLRIAGAAYMVFLGARILWSSVLRRPSAGHDEMPAPDERAWVAWRRGLVTNLLNPKVGAFYVAVLPQFLPEQTSPLAMGLLLALVHNVEGLIWFTALTLGATRMRTLLQGRRARRGVDGVTGTALMGFGLHLGLSR